MGLAESVSAETLQMSKTLGLAGRVARGQQKAGNQLRPGDRPGPTIRCGLDQAGHKQIVVLRMKKHAGINRADPLPISRLDRIDERNRDAKSGRIDQHVDRFAAAIGKADPIAIEGLHVGFTRIFP